jgi:hypothetical protein
MLAMACSKSTAGSSEQAGSSVVVDSAHRSVAQPVLPATVDSNDRRPTRVTESQSRAGTVPGDEDRAWYRTGRYLYEGNRCSFVPRDSANAIGFECGVIEIVLQPGLSVQDAQPVVGDLSASIDKAFQGPRASLFLRVLEHREQESILRAYEHRQVVRAGLSLSRRGVY